MLSIHIICYEEWNKIYIKKFTQDRKEKLEKTMKSVLKQVEEEVYKI